MAERPLVFVRYCPSRLVLIGSALLYWHPLRAKEWMQAAFRGMNAAIVGILLAALYNPMWTEGVTNPRDAATGIIAFALLQWWKTPPWLVVLLAAAAGQWLLH